MLARVVVVDDDLDDLALGKHERARVGPVDVNVGGEVAGAERGVEGRDFGALVGDVVEESAGEKKEGVSRSLQDGRGTGGFYRTSLRRRPGCP